VYAVSKEVGKVGNNSPDFVVPMASRENRKNIANFFGGGKKEEEGKKGGVKGEGGEKEEVKDEVSKKEEVKDEVGKKEEQDRKEGLREEVKYEVGKKEEQDRKEGLKEETAKKEERDENEDLKGEPIKMEDADSKPRFKPEIIKKDEDSRPDFKGESKQGIKREHDDSLDLSEPMAKATRTSSSASPVDARGSPLKSTAGGRMRSATRNDRGVVVPKAARKGTERGTQKITGFFGKK
jgi:hypothetical protein